MQAGSTDNEMLEELKKIRELLTPAPAAAPPKGMRNEFLAFLAQYKVLGLAVAFIMGVYLGAVVMNLVEDILLPAIGVVFPGLGNLTTYTSTVNHQNFLLGAFTVSVITFIIIAFVIFLIVKIANRWGLNK